MKQLTIKNLLAIIDSADHFISNELDVENWTQIKEAVSQELAVRKLVDFLEQLNQYRPTSATNRHDIIKKQHNFEMSSWKLIYADVDKPLEISIANSSKTFDSITKFIADICDR